jgi:large subunit ribosomal protein L17
MAIALLQKERISTTLARAKQLRRMIERLINLGKKQDFNSRRMAFKLLQHRDTVALLFKDVALRFKETNSGYTRIIHFRNRRGDCAQMVIMELTILKPKEKKPPVAKKKKETPKTAETPVKPEKIEKKTEEIIEPKVKEGKREIPPPKEEKPEGRKEAEQPRPGKEAERGKKAEPAKKKIETPAKKTEKKGFLDGLRDLFRRKKQQREG